MSSGDLQIYQVLTLDALRTWLDSRPGVESFDTSLGPDNWIAAFASDVIGQVFTMGYWDDFPALRITREDGITTDYAYPAWLLKLYKYAKFKNGSEVTVNRLRLYVHDLRNISLEVDRRSL